MVIGSNAVPDAITLIDAPYERKFTALTAFFIYKRPASKFQPPAANKIAPSVPSLCAKDERCDSNCL
jgi:hypothetical protein